MGMGGEWCGGGEGWEWWWTGDGGEGECVTGCVWVRVWGEGVGWEVWEWVDGVGEECGDGVAGGYRSVVGGRGGEAGV